MVLSYSYSFYIVLPALYSFRALKSTIAIEHYKIEVLSRTFHSTISEQHICRLVNLLTETNLGTDTIWILIKGIKVQMLKEKTPIKEHDGYYSKAVLSGVMKLEKELHIKPSSKTNGNVTTETFRTASDMLIFLMIPIESDLAKTWLPFYWNLFQTKSATEIILTLNRLMKKTLEIDVSAVNLKLYTRTTSLFSLNNEDIKILKQRNILEENYHNMSIKTLSMDGMK